MNSIKTLKLSTLKVGDVFFFNGKICRLQEITPKEEYNLQDTGYLYEILFNTKDDQYWSEHLSDTADMDVLVRDVWVGRDFTYRFPKLNS